MELITVYASIYDVWGEVEDYQLIKEIERRLGESSSFKREFCQSEDIQKAFDKEAA